jgi:hypothetical protein
VKDLPKKDEPPVLRGRPIFDFAVNLSKPQKLVKVLASASRAKETGVNLH